MFYKTFQFLLILLHFQFVRLWEPACSPKSEELRFDCHPDENASQESCQARKCCWSNPLSGSFNRGPACYFPDNYPGFMLYGSTILPDRTIYRLRRNEETNFIYTPINDLTLEVISVSADIVRVRITDTSNSNRFEVPYVLEDLQTYTGHVNYRHELSYTSNQNNFELFGLKIYRTRSDSEILLFDSTIAPLIYSDQFIQLSSKLPSQNVYGLGEHRTQFQISANWRKMSFWTRDQATVRDDNLYGAHPFLLSFDQQNNAFGYFMLNSNAMETKFTPLPSITYRTIGGIVDMFIFMGPTGSDVISQYLSVVGFPLMAPYWSLGYHLSRWNYGTLNNLRTIVQNMKNIDFPYDVQWTDIDALREKRIFTYDTVNWAGFPEFVQQLHDDDKKYISINDPGIACDPSITDYETYKTGLAADVYIKWGNGSGYLIGEVWPGLTVYPDWTHPNSQQWWTDELVLWNKTLPVDGLWIDMNEVSSFVYGSVDGCSLPLDNPLFVPEIFEKKLWAKTICTSAIQTVSNQYNMHSLYGHTWAMRTYYGMLEVHPGKRPFILTRSSFSGSAKYTSKWGGDNFATFNDLYYSITDILNFNMFGFAQTGDDLCGFIFDTTTELCTRWHQLGSLYTFMRNHNNDESAPHDPTTFDDNIRQIMKSSLISRYELLPFMYSLLYRASKTGKPLYNALMFEFPSDKQAHQIDTQFLFGEALMSAPVLINNARLVDVYFPTRNKDANNNEWFVWPSGQPLNIKPGGEWRRMNAPLDKHWMFIRSGFIIPTHIVTNFSQNAVQNKRSSKFRIYAVIGPNRQEELRGNLYWDDGESLLEYNSYNYVSFRGHDNMIVIESVFANYTDANMVLNEIVVFGIHQAVRSVRVNDRTHDLYTFDAGLDKFVISGLNLRMDTREIHVVRWEY